MSLQDAIDRLRALAELPERLAPKVAEAVRDEVAKQIAAGQGPDGKPWQLTKTGKQPLRNAAAALRASAVGSVAILTLEGPEVLHHEGRAKGKIRRPILPGRKLNGAVVRAVNRVIAEAIANGA